LITANPQDPATLFQPPSNEILIQQVADAHAENVKLQRRNASLQYEMGRRIHQVQTEKQPRVDDLERELRQCRAREEAVQAVFIQNFEETQELAEKSRALERDEDRLRQREESVNIRDVMLEEKRSKFGEYLALHNAQSVEKVKSRDQEVHNKATLPKPSRGLTNPDIYLQDYGNEHIPLFVVNSRHNFEKYNMDVSFESMNGIQVQLLRRHDYYTGWLHSRQLRVTDEDDVKYNFHLAADSYGPHKFDANLPFTTSEIGINAGFTFAWAALCNEVKPEWGVRLDD
jgi:hypothetical protein